jgi:hypothetical protein
MKVGRRIADGAADRRRHGRSVRVPVPGEVQASERLQRIVARGQQRERLGGATVFYKRPEMLARSWKTPRIVSGGVGCRQSSRSFPLSRTDRALRERDRNEAPQVRPAAAAKCGCVQPTGPREDCARHTCGQGVRSARRGYEPACSGSTAASGVLSLKSDKALIHVVATRPRRRWCGRRRADRRCDPAPPARLLAPRGGCPLALLQGAQRNRRSWARTGLLQCGHNSPRERRLPVNPVTGASGPSTILCVTPRSAPISVATPTAALRGRGDACTSPDSQHRHAATRPGGDPSKAPHHSHQDRADTTPG